MKQVIDMAGDQDMPNPKMAPETAANLRAFVEEKQGACPFARRPFRTCYHMRLYAPLVKEALYYCALNYNECEIYRNALGLNAS